MSLGRIPITFSTLASVLSGVAVANIAHCDEVVKAIESGTLLQVALATFRACDPGNSGYLKYDDGGIRDLVTTVFRQLRMKAPPESHIFHVFKVFDIRNRNYLTGCECICLVDGVMRAVVDIMLQKTPVAAKGVPNFFTAEESQRQPSGSPHAAAALPPVAIAGSSSSYVVGQRVEIFSRSRKRWVEGVVSHIGADGAVTVLYEDGNNEKTVPQQLITEILRVSSKESSSRQAALPSKILPGQQLEIYSSSQDQWMLGEVVSVQEDGSLVVFYGSNSKKTVPPSHFGTAIRAVQAAAAASGAEVGHALSTPVAKLLQDGAGTPSQSIAEQLHRGGACAPKQSSNNSSTTTNAGAASASALKLGQPVNVFSNGQGRWVSGFVVNLDPEGHVTVKYGDTLKTVAKEEIPGVIRALPEGVADSAGGAAAAGGNTSASAYSAGQPVEVYSKSQGRWCLGVVLQVDASYGAVTVQYGETLKTIAKEDLQSDLRSASTGAPAVSSTAPPPIMAGAPPQQSTVAPQAAVAAVAAVPPPRVQDKSPPMFGGAAASRSSGLVLGQHVEVFSQSQNSWRQAQVIMVTLSGPITVQYGTTQKTIAEEDLASMVRSCQTDSPVPEAPRSIYDLGEQVEAYSMSQGKWNAGQIIGLCLDGAVVVQYGETQKTIAMEEMPKVLRKGAGSASAPMGQDAPARQASWQQAAAGQKGGSSICMSALRPSAPPVAAAEASDTPSVFDRRGGGSSVCMSAARPSMHEAAPSQAPPPNLNAGCSICMSAAAPQDPNWSSKPSVPVVVGDPDAAWPVGPGPAACRGQSICFSAAAAAVPQQQQQQQWQPSLQQEDRGVTEMPQAGGAPRDLRRLPAGTRLEARLRDKEGRPTRRYHPCTLEGVNPNGTLRVRFDDGSVNLEMFPEDCEMPGAATAEVDARAPPVAAPWLAAATNAVAAAAAGAAAEPRAAIQQPEQVSVPPPAAANHNVLASPSPPLGMAADPFPHSSIQQGEEQEAGLLIWMHGLMGSGDEFENLLKATVGQNLPWIQWELPNAQVQAVSCKGGCAVPSWFDVLEMPITNERPHAGLMETVNRVHVMIRRAEMRGILASRVALGGLSQGGVVALAAGLSYERRLACVCALSSWLPGGLLSMRLNHLDTPIMLGHGTEDRTVGPEVVEEAVAKLRQAGCSSVSLQKYPGLGHSVVFDEFTDLEDLLRRTIPSTPAAQ